MEKVKKYNYEKLLANGTILYFIFGLFFALFFAYYYHWEWFGYFSPNFFVVLLTWPYQAIGFSADLLYYGTSQKPI